MHSCCLLLIQFQPISLLVAIETAMLNGSPMNFHYDIFKVAVGTMKQHLRKQVLKIEWCLSRKHYAPHH